MFFHLISLIALLPAVLLHASTSSARSDDPPELKQWPASITHELAIPPTSKVIDQAGNALQNALFDSIDETDLFKKHWNGGFSVRSRVEREVFENHDLLDTWTVIDHFKFGASRPVPTGLDLAAPAPVGLSMGLTASAESEWINIRQVPARKYTTLPSATERRDELFGDITELNIRNPWYLFDPSIRPRFGKIWNFLNFPFHLPISRKTSHHLQAGELISYSATGTVELSGRIGFKILPIPGQALVPGLDPELTVRTYLSGTYRITVFQETDRHAKVKLSRVGTWGKGLGLNGRSSKVVPFEGVFVLKNISGRIIPFRFNLDQENSRLFDVGYRYDLSDELAREAFRQAVAGKFEASEILTARSRNDREKRVEQIVHRTGRQKRATRRKSIDLMAYSRRNTQTRDAVDVSIQLPDGKHHVFQSTVKNEKDWRNAFGAREKNHHTFTVGYDLESYSSHNPASLFLVCEVLIEDSNTRFKEMARYVRDAETAIGKPGILPGVSQFTRPERIRTLGRSSFYYGLNLPRAALEKFFRVPDGRKRFILESVIGNAALERKLFERWVEVSRSTDPKEKSRLLTRFLSIPRLGRQMLLILRLGLEGTEIDYFINASNASFGRVQHYGKASSIADQILDAVSARIGFERSAQGYRGDPLANVSHLKATPLADGKVRIDFDLDQIPLGLYFRLNRTSGWRFFKTEKELLFDNHQGRFRKGSNTLILDRDSLEDLLGQKLGDRLESGNFYTLNVGFTRDKVQWSLNQTVRFQVH